MVKCQYCGKTVVDGSDICPMCGAPVPRQEAPTIAPIYHTPPKPAPPAKNNARILLSLGLLALVLAVFYFLLRSGLSNTATNQQVNSQQVQSAQGENETDAKRLPPHAVFSDSGLRQSMELLFSKELSRLDWPDIDKIRTVAIEGDIVKFAFEGITLADIDNDAAIYALQPDAAIADLQQLQYFANLEVLSLPNGNLTADILQSLPRLKELHLRAGSTISDLTLFSELNDLRKLSIAGNNLVSLKGISDLENLNSLSLTSTGVSDLSVLSMQRNIIELKLTDNRNLSSLNTIQEMAWLKSLHIERCENVNLHFISNLTELESLSVIRTDTKNVDFIIPLTKLRVLQLAQNDQVLEMPSFADFSQLAELYIDCGKVSDPQFLRGLTSVRKMTILRPDSLEPLRAMKNLEELTLRFGWLLTDISPLGDLSGLKSLKIFDSKTYDQLKNIDAIGKLSGLEKLDLANCDNFFDAGFIYQLTNLQELDLSNNIVVGDFAAIRNLQNLQVLRLNKVYLSSYYRWQGSNGMIDIYYSDPIPLETYSSSLASLGNLEILSLDQNKLESIDFVSELHKLKTFSAQDNYIKDVSPLSNLKQLEYVNLLKNPVSNWETVKELVNTTITGR